MHPRNANILQPNLTLMAPSHLYCILVLRADHVQAALFFTLLAFVDALEDRVGVFWLVYCDHLQVEIIRRPCHHPRKWLLADFALEFCEIIRNHHARNLLLDLAINPHLQALHMDPLARALALARRNEEVIRGIIITQTELACTCNLLVCFMHSVELSEE